MIVKIVGGWKPLPSNLNNMTNLVFKLYQISTNVIRLVFSFSKIIILQQLYIKHV